MISGGDGSECFGLLLQIPENILNSQSRDLHRLETEGIMFVPGTPAYRTLISSGTIADNAFPVSEETVVDHLGLVTLDNDVCIAAIGTGRVIGAQ